VSRQTAGPERRRQRLERDGDEGRAGFSDQFTSHIVVETAELQPRSSPRRASGPLSFTRKLGYLPIATWMMRVHQWRNNRACKACSARGPSAVGAQNLPDAVFKVFLGRGGPFGILARGPTATLLRHWVPCKHVSGVGRNLCMGAEEFHCSALR